MVPKRRETLAAYARIRELAKGYYENVSLRSDKDFDFEGENALSSLMGKTSIFMGMFYLF
jgi:hypothetical protein